MVAYSFRMPAGIPGGISRAWPSVVQGQPTDMAAPPLSYGCPVVIDSTTQAIRAFAAADANTSIYGLLVRPYPTSSVGATGPYNESYPLGNSIPPNFGMQGVLRSGYMTVLLSGAAASAKGTPVYVWMGATGGGHVLGGFEGAATAGSTIILPNAEFEGAADAQGNVEISYNI
jgi:hypothetical protein